ncbi:MAG: hypothetical protein GX345_03230 [Clostridiales bacterium]|nr:hypothetical protein [Clostridiales bacterium]
MIGLGKWVCHVDTMFFRGDAYIRLFDDNGQYGFELTLPDMDVPEITVSDVVEDDNTLTAVARTDLLPGKDISVSLTFEEDTFTGLLKVPFIGKIKLKDGKRVE